MKFTNKFPYTTINNINLDWIIKRVKELGETVSSYANDIANAVALAEAAQEAADSVTGTAESAVATAQAAEATANAIAGTANSALTTAQAAETTARAAETTANRIAATANTALETAQAANATAQAANTTAQAAEERANNAETIAGSASANASNAIQTANTALATAEAANTTAKAAEERANNAETIAGTANANASNAVHAANTALATAEAANTTAQAAEESANNAETIAGTANANASNAVQAANTALATAEAALSEKAGKLVDTETGAIASFVPDRTIEQVLSVSVAVEPVQAGSGDPSPDNVRPISGWSAVGVEASSINAWDEEWLNGFLGDAGAYISNASSICAKNFIAVHPGQTMFFVLPSGATARICAYSADGTYLKRLYAYNSVFTVPDNAYKIRFSIYGYGTTYNNDVSINYPATDHAYHPYTGNAYTITIGHTVYGGTLDVTGGKMYARPFFLSYNGQTLIGPWISSMDVYAEGTTPTIGAEVVDMGGTPTVYDIGPVQIATIVGQTNNVWADAGNVTVEFAADLKWYIDKEIAELQALVLENGG